MSDISKLEQKMDKRFDQMMKLLSDFANDVNARFDQQDARFDQHDARFDQHDINFARQESRFDKIEERLTKLEESHNKLMNTIDGFIKRIDDYEVELAARDHKIDRLERWIEQIAQKTGVKLT